MHPVKSAAGQLSPPDGGFGWVVVFGSFLIHVVAFGVIYSYGALLPTLLDVFREGEAFTGAVGSTLFGVTLSVGPIAAALVNKYGCRPVTCVGGVIATIGTVLSMFSPNVTFLLMSFGILTGFGLGLIYLPAIVSVTQWFEMRRAFATGIAVCGSGIGTFIFAPVSVALIDEYNWNGALLIIAGILFNCCVFGALFRPVEYDAVAIVETTVPNDEPDSPLDSPQDEVMPLRDLTVVEVRRPKISTINFQSSVGEDGEVSWLNKASIVLTEMMDPSLMKDWSFIWFAISNFFTSMAFQVPYIFLADRAEKDLNVEKSSAAFLLAIIGITNVIGRIFFGFLSDRPKINRLYLYNVAVTIAGVSMCLSVFCTNYVSLAFFAAVFGTFIGAFVTLTSVILVDLFGIERLTNSFGILLFALGIAAFIGPPLAGHLKEVTSSYNSAFIVFGIMMAGSGLMLFFIPILKRMENTCKKKGKIT